MRTTLAILILLAAIGVGGCAASPEKIEAAYVGNAIYSGLDCADLAAEQARLADGLRSAAKRQRTARGHDTVGVILFCVPIGSLGGNNRTQEIARLKGELAALQATAVEQGCTLPEIGDPVAKK